MIDNPQREWEIKQERLAAAEAGDNAAQALVWSDAEVREWEQREAELAGKAPHQKGNGKWKGRAERERGGKPEAPAKQSRVRHEWQSAFRAVTDRSRGTGLPSAMRCVLLIVNCYMNPDGTGAYPGQARIAREAGLSLFAVKFHLRLAEKRGWLKRERTFKSQYGTGYQYVATIPDGATTLPPQGSDATRSQGSDATRSQGSDATRSPQGSDATQGSVSNEPGQRQQRTRVVTLPQPGITPSNTTSAGAGPLAAGRGGAAKQTATPLNKPSLIRPRPFKTLPGPHYTGPLPGTRTRFPRFELESLKEASNKSLIRPSCPWPRVH